jgi:hypothetical protein
MTLAFIKVIQITSILQVYCRCVHILPVFDLLLKRFFYSL